jgi:hypothetical protein
MNTTVAAKSKPATVSIELKVKVTKPAKEGMTAHDFKREIDDAIEVAKGVTSAAEREGSTATVEGRVIIGKQKFKL